MVKINHERKKQCEMLAVNQRSTVKARKEKKWKRNTEEEEKKSTTT